MKRAAIVVASAWAALSACSKGAPDPGEVIVATVERVAAAVEAGGDDCDKIADGVSSVVDHVDRDAIKAAEDKLRNDEALSKEMETKYAPRLKTAWSTLERRLAKCGDNKKWRQVEGALGALPKSL